MLRPVITRATGCLMLAVFLTITAGCVTTDGPARPPCDLNNPKEKIYKLKIQTTDVNGKVTPTGVNHGDGSSANLLHTCPGDTVKWELKDHEFVIAFDKGTTSPFSWTSGKATEIGTGNWWLQGLIEDKDPKDEPLKYSIAIVNGGKYDPVIIVDR